MKTRRFILLISVSVSLLLSGCGPGQFLGPTITPTPTLTLTATATSTNTPLPTDTPTLEPSPTITLTPTSTPLPAVFLTMFVNEYDTFTVYRQHSLWENALGGKSVSTEDFEQDTADYGELSNPYLTGNGFLLQGVNCPAQIINDATLLPSGNVLHFRDFGSGLTFVFPNRLSVSAFGFDYRPSENWKLTVNDTILDLPEGRPGFIGIVITADYPTEFKLSSDSRVQGGLTVDNISYVPTTLP